MFEPAISQGLRTVAGACVPLQGVRVNVQFSDLLCETMMTQVFRNLEDQPIEAVYTFPLASSAALLNLKVVIGDRELLGVVVERKEAEDKYEDAIADGKTAIMLEQLEPGMFAMNVGNILPGETVAISLVYSELYNWQGNTLRFHLPTTIAPRYGDPEDAGLEGHQIPEYDFSAENRFQLEVTIRGKLAEAEIECPSHLIKNQTSKDAAIISLAGDEACMDRDFILNIRARSLPQDSAFLAHDLNGHYVALVSFVPKINNLGQGDGPPRSIKIVVDCSGSMTGDSIGQARHALREILGQLRSEDYCNVFAFGSTVKSCFTRQAPANIRNISALESLIERLDADMGGTEMEKALQAAISSPGPDLPQDILLITDGEVWGGGEKIVQQAKASGHRIFTVGVGSSVSERLVRQLAQETGGACELVAPNEKMAGKIVRHFKRIYLPRAADVEVSWPIRPKEVIPSTLGTVFDGDTLHVFACFAEKPTGQAVLKMTLADGRKLAQAVVVPQKAEPLADEALPGSVTRLAMQQKLSGEKRKTAAQLAVKYQLVSPYTNYLVVKATDEDRTEQELPVLRKVPQMLSAGWGGFGSALACSAPSDSYNKEFYSQVDKYNFIESSGKLIISRQKSPRDFVFALNRFQAGLPGPVWQQLNFAILAKLGLPENTLQQLRAIAASHAPDISEEKIALAFLVTLAGSPVGKGFSLNTRREIKKGYKILHLENWLLDLMAPLANNYSKNWGLALP